jgi:MoxR-like ATPase
MQERQITLADETFKAPDPFLVMATQNPVESEGAYRLPEAQLDRFMLKVNVTYNTFDEEIDIVSRVAVNGFESINQVATLQDIQNLKNNLKKVHVDKDILEYMMKIVFATRNPQEYGVDGIAQYIEYGASPRASIDLYKASCAYAMIRGNDYVTPLDISYIVGSVLRHRIILNYKAQAENIDTDYIIKQIMQNIKNP